MTFCCPLPFAFFTMTTKSLLPHSYLCGQTVRPAHITRANVGKGSSKIIVQLISFHSPLPTYYVGNICRHALLNTAVPVIIFNSLLYYFMALNRSTLITKHTIPFLALLNRLHRATTATHPDVPLPLRKTHHGNL